MMELPKHPFCRQLAVAATNRGQNGRTVILLVLRAGGMPRPQPLHTLGVCEAFQCPKTWDVVRPTTQSHEKNCPEQVEKYCDTSRTTSTECGSAGFRATGNVNNTHRSLKTYVGVCAWFAVGLVGRAAKRRAGVPVPRPVQEAQVADPPPGLPELRHTHGCEPALPHGPPTPRALRLPQHWKNHPPSPPREAPRGRDRLLGRRAGGGGLFSRLPHLFLSAYAIKSFLVAPLPAAPEGVEALSWVFIALWTSGRASQSSSLLLRARGQERRRSLNVPSQWGAAKDKGSNSAGQTRRCLLVLYAVGCVLKVGIPRRSQVE
ncbi:uncharacterized protein LOC131489595 [Neofelis nebulosa]|uniref:uncharacterized protein LOC131489595 n=1 Tax=Neofelis nebulosa TaxID=61452 RepID=UPI00272C175A|nr:uncharacterized protein LOC131489595 [Neofelis nebulosa]